MKVVVGFSRAKSPWKIGSKVIQIAEKRDFSHAYIIFTCQITGYQLVAQASHGSVNLMNYDIFCEHNDVCEEYLLECNEEQYLEIIKFIFVNLGKDYSTMQIMFISLKKLLHFEVPKYNKDKEYICSEFAARVCEIKGIRMPTHLDYFTPSDLNTLIKDIKLPRIR